MRTTRLDRLLAVRASLRPGEVVTVLAPVAGELAGLHGGGRAHGGVSTAAIGLDADGRPRLLAPDDEADPTASPDADVRALAALVTELVGPYPPDTLIRVARDGADGLHDAAGLQSALLAACRAEPVRLPRTLPADDAVPAEQGRSAAARRRPTGQWLLPSGAPAPRPSRRLPPRPWTVRPSGRVVAAVGTSFLLAVAVAAGVAAAGSSRAEAPSSDTSTTHATSRDPRHASPSSSRSSWRATLRALDKRRSTAFARGDASILHDVYTKASAPLEADLATLHAYGRRDLRVRGLHLALVAVHQRSRSQTTAVLRVTDRLDGYWIVDAGGRVVRREPGRDDEVTWQMTLRRTHGRWRIAAIHRVDG